MTVSSSDDDIPLGSMKHSKKRSLAKVEVKKEVKNRKKQTIKTVEDDDDMSLAQINKRKLKKIKLETTESSLSVKSENGGVKSETESVKKEEDNEEEDEEYKWWENNQEDDTIKWTTLHHSGVLFPPDYIPLPSHVKLYYDGKPVELPEAAEEVAGFFSNTLHLDHSKNPVFQKNFFHDFKQVLQENGGTLNNIEIESFDKLNFNKIAEYYELQKEQKKQLTKMERKQLKMDKDKVEEPYKFCELDGRREQVGNFRIEPPDLFRGRGAHPKTGKLKRRVKPEDIILNLSKDAKVPTPPKGHQWGEIRHDNTVQWLAMWRENIFNSFKYVRLAANSSLKGQSDLKKFEKARELKKYIDVIRKDYKRDLKSKIMLERQKAAAIYLIDVFALRAGGEKNDDEADTVGCCSLRYEHVTLRPPNTVIFDFLGKDSIRYYQEVEVDKQVFKDLTIFKRPPKQPGDQLFDRLDPSILNKHLQNYMSGLTAKVFRTYNASKTMQDQLDLIPNKGSVAEKLLRYNAANRTVAILCNHQRTITKGHAQSVEKANQRIRELEWERNRCKKAILQMDPDEIKNNKSLFKKMNEFSKAEEKEIHLMVIQREEERMNKKFQRDNEKLIQNGEDPLPQSTLDDWLDKVYTKKEQLAEEINNNGPIIVRPTLNTVEKLKTHISRLDERIKVQSIQLKDKEENSEVSLGTSKTNYIDPRLTVVFCRKYQVPIEKVFTKTLREKFKWAIESADENWRF